MRRLLVCALACVALAGCQDREPAAPSPAGTINDIADRYYAWRLQTLPEIAYFSAVELDRHDSLYDNSPEALAANQATEDALLAEVEAVDNDALLGLPEWITYALLEQELRSLVDTRVCRQELWDVNQMGGWHLAYTQIATMQPVDSAELRQQAITRWSKFAARVDQAIANLEAGIEAGYSAPKSVVERVIAQVDGLLGLAVSDTPFYSMVTRADDAEFAAAMGGLIEDDILPAYQRYRDYLDGEYLEQARADLSVTANPDGAACYEASLRSYTTVDRSGADVYELGRVTVEANRADVIRMGQEAYDLGEFADILEAARSDPENRFADKDELLEFSIEAVRRAEAEMPNWVGRMPGQAAEVVPFPEHEEGTGRSARYEPGDDTRPGRYMIPLHKPEEQVRGNAEATAFHEVWPGHHLQVAAFREVAGAHPVGRIIWFSGPGEGWARYSEALAEEMGLFTTTSGPILRRAWPARGMVVDPGIHLFGWTREQAGAFMLESGRFPPSQIDALIDRIAILPGQLTAYDSGALEIVALRREAEAALGDAFDIREFHDRVLENGTIPLGYLRQHIERWIAGRTE